MVDQKKIKINMGTFDLIKGIAIIFVVFFHISFHYKMEELLLFSPVFVLEKLLNYALMPMFFIISGYTLKRKDGLKVLKQTFTQLILPYLCASIASIVLYALFHWKLDGAQHTVQVTKMNLLQVLLCGDIAGPLWYFVALFWAENILNLILKFKNEVLQFFAVAVSITLGFVLGHFGVPFRLMQGLTAVGFCYLGYILKKKNLVERMINCPWTYIVLGLIFLIQAFGGWILDIELLKLEMAGEKYSIISLFASACGGLFLVFVGILWSQMKWKCLEPIRSLGAKTYWILIAHTVEYLSVPWYHLRVENESVYIAFLTDVFLRVVFISLGCGIIKRISQYSYMKKRMRKNAKV